VGVGEAGGQGFTKLYFGSVHFSIGEEDIKSIFAPFGEVLALSMHRDPETGRSKGFGFVTYKEHESAKNALEQLNGLELAGRNLKVGLASAEMRPGLPMAQPAQPMVGSAGAAGFGGGPGGFGPPPPSMGTINELDEGKDGGLGLSANQRTMLMQRLAREDPILPGSAAPSKPAVAAPAPSLNTPLASTEVPSRCVMLKNMFNPATETNPAFHEEVAEEVSEECASKFGPLKHLFVDKNSAGIVFMKFGEVAHAANAKQTLGGRWFAGQMVSADFIAEPVYYTRFSNAQD